jgi:hypothetical protein
MGKRLVFLGIALPLILLFAHSSLKAETATIFDVFLWLFLLLVVTGVALWPSTGRDQNVELELERRGWADRIEIQESAAAKPRTPAARHTRQVHDLARRLKRLH